MGSTQRFSFTNNSLSKGMYLKGFFNILFFQSKRNYRKAHALIANYFKVDQDQVFLFGAGRMSVYTLIKSLRLTEQDEVIIAGYTCVVLTNAVKFTGCKVRYVDISRKTLNLDTSLFIEKITNQTKMLIVPHNFGIPYNDILTIKEQFPSLIIMEDVAHSFGSTSEGELCGTLGDAGFFSLEYSKPLTSGLGGILILKNRDLLPAFNEAFEKLGEMSGSTTRKLIATLGTYNLSHFKRTTFFYKSSLRVLRMFRLLYQTSTKEIDGELPDDYPVKMRKSLTCFLVPQLSRIEQINAKKRQLTTIYEAEFNKYSDLEKFVVKEQVLVRYPILFKEHVNIDTIEAIKTEGIALGLNFGVWFNDVVHPAGSFRYCYDTGSCPIGEYVAPRILNLPVNANYTNMTKEINDIAALFKKHGIN